MKRYVLLFVLAFICCKSQKKSVLKPNYINFILFKDSIYVSVKNPLACPTFLILNNYSSDSIINLKVFEERTILKIKDSLLDTLAVLKKYNPTLKYDN
jgi:hypothetical protein